MSLFYNALVHLGCFFIFFSDHKEGRLDIFLLQDIEDRLRIPAGAVIKGQINPMHIAGLRKIVPVQYRGLHCRRRLCRSLGIRLSHSLGRTIHNIRGKLIDLRLVLRQYAHLPLELHHLDEQKDQHHKRDQKPGNHSQKNTAFQPVYALPALQTVVQIGFIFHAMISMPPGALLGMPPSDVSIISYFFRSFYGFLSISKKEGAPISTPPPLFFIGLYSCAATSAAKSSFFFSRPSPVSKRTKRFTETAVPSSLPTCSRYLPTVCLPSSALT